MKNHNDILGATVTGTTTHGDPFTGTVVRVDQGSDTSGPTLSIEVDGLTIQHRLPEFGWTNQWLTIETTTLAKEVK